MLRHPHRHTPSAALWVALLACLTAPVRAADQGTVLVGDLSAFHLIGKPDVSKIQVAGQPFAEATAVDIRSKPSSAPALEWKVSLDQPVAKGEILLMSVWARLVSTPEENNEGRIGLIVEEANSPTFDKVLSRQFGVSSTWRRFDLPARAGKDYAAGELTAHLRLGYYVQSLELAGVSLRKYSPATDLSSLPETKASYAGRAPDAAWRQAAADRIERLRKAPLTVRAVDREGNALANAAVEVRMKRHAFPFGGVYNLALINGSQADTADGAIFRDVFPQLFNTAVDEWACKWPAWVDPDKRQKAIDAIAWMHARNIPVRGHTMIWPSWRRSPESVRKLADDPAALEQAALDHIRDIGTTLAGKVIEWDVVNEPINHNDILKIVGEEALIDWFKAARQADPNAVLYLNEAGVPNSPPEEDRYDKFYNHVQRLQKAGAPIGGIGMQGHFGWNLNAPTQILGIYDRFAKLGLPIRITELDIDVTDSELQYDYMRDFLTASFSHPSINGVLTWCVWEGRSWKPAAALFDKQWRLTGAGRAWKEMIFKQWWTYTDGRTDAAGAYALRGFLGDYEITVRHAGRQRTVPVALGSRGESVTVTLE